MYFVYTQFRQPANPSPQQVQVRRQGVEYSLQIAPGSQSAYRLVFSVSNRRSHPRDIPVPEGVKVLLSDGRRLIYWKKHLELASTLKLSAGENRSWNVRVPSLPRSEGELYAGFYLDEDRQGMLKIPASMRPDS